MKRCSQCDFIYEDDQHLCDMDGHELVYEPTLHGFQVNAVNAETKPSTGPVKPPRRRIVLLAAVAVLIGTVLSVGYSGLTREYAPQNTKAPSTDIIRAPQSAPDQTPATPAVIPAPSPSHAPLSEKPGVNLTNASPIATSTEAESPIATSTEAASPVATSTEAASPVATSTEAASPIETSTEAPVHSTASRRETMRSQPARANHKKESRIGDFLKKTGKLLKKPFKRL
jgi:hypothetical protein